MSSVEALAVLRVISSIISIVEADKKVYDAATDAQGLPRAFHEVASRLPIVKSILYSAGAHVSKEVVDEDSCREVKPVVEACEKKARKLHELFKHAIATDGTSDLKRYYKAVKVYGKGNDVETLMKGMLEDIQLLAFEHGMRIATEAQRQQITLAVKDLSEVVASVPDTEFQDTGLNAFNSGPGTQFAGQGEYVAQGEYIAQAVERMYNSGGGPMYNSAGGPIHCGTRVDETQTCLKALFLTDPRDDRAKLVHFKGSRVNGTCTWIKDNALYKSWLCSKSQLLWLSGGPGKGKTMLSIFIAEELEHAASLSQTAIFLQYFCDNKDEKRNSASAIIRGLLFQLLQSQPKLFNHIVPSFKIQERNLFTTSSFESLWRIFANMIRDPLLHDTYCILDGLDECDQTSLEILLKRFQALFSAVSGRFKLIIVSRDYPRFITDILASFPRIQLDSDTNTNISNDIRHFINFKVDELSSSSSRPYPKSLREHVRKVFESRSQGTFLWIGLAAKALKEYEVTEIEHALNLLPRSLDKLYSRLLLQIAEERRNIAARILCWVVMAVRPLRLSELSSAVEIALRPSSSFKAVDAMRDHVLRCGYVLTIKANKDSERDEDAEVSLIHQSAKDYLLRKERDPNPDLEAFRVREDAGNLEIARKCLAYLQSGVLQNTEIHRAASHGTLRAFPATDNQYLRDFPLVPYATLYWPHHAKSLSSSEDIFDLSLPFYDGKPEIWRSWLGIYYEWEYFELAPKSFTLLHLASTFGILPLAEKILDKKGLINRIKRPLYINQRDRQGKTALFIAAKDGHEAIVRLLLDKGVDIDTKDNFGSTALITAAEGGHEIIVRLLLEKGADVDSKDDFGCTPMIMAANGGHDNVMRLLLEKRRV